MVYHERSVVHLDIQVLPGAVVVQKIPTDACALRHPIEPDPAAGAIDAILADRAVDWRMDLNPRHLRSGKVPDRF